MQYDRYDHRSLNFLLKKKSCKEAIKIFQVGDGASDHYCWERAEDMTTPRNAYKLDASHPGSDLAGETAAALAAAAIAFKPYNSSYSDLLLVHAKQVSAYLWSYPHDPLNL